MKKNGFEPSQENLNLVLDFMEQSYFWMMRGGCDPADVEDYIFMVADMTMTDFIHSGELQSCEMVEDETNAQPDDTSLKEQYYEWCAAHPDEDRQTCGKYGPEFRIRVDAPIDGLAEVIRDAGFEPTMERLDLLMREMQGNRFDDKHGGCPAEVVLERILGQASGCIELLVENGECEEAED